MGAGLQSVPEDSISPRYYYGLLDRRAIRLEAIIFCFCFILFYFIFDPNIWKNAGDRFTKPSGMSYGGLHGRVGSFRNRSFQIFIFLSWGNYRVKNVTKK